MTIETWKAKYYPIPAKQIVESGASELDCVRHSIVKFYGLSSRVLEQHELEKVDDNIYEHVQDSDQGIEKNLAIDADSCALCILNGACDCILDALGYTCGSIGSPYRQWLRSGDPKAMIAALRECEEVLKNA